MNYLSFLYYDLLGHFYTYFSFQLLVSIAQVFQELTSSQGLAKLRFERDDLLERGRALIEESIDYGVTRMRAFVKVDKTAGTKCLDAGLALKKEFKDRCHVQICSFAQDPIYSQDDCGKEMLHLMEEAACQKGVDVKGSTPCVAKLWQINMRISSG
jgi:cytosine/adenosine deaminase-related metal-dependent hydrolase